MPIYDFYCKKCESVYDELVVYDATGKYKGVKCPQCGSKKKEKLVDQLDKEIEAEEAEEATE
jgi:putative FmdB family regulatory protein